MHNKFSNGNGRIEESDNNNQDSPESSQENQAENLAESISGNLSLLLDQINGLNQSLKKQKLMNSGLKERLEGQFLKIIKLQDEIRILEDKLEILKKEQSDTTKTAVSEVILDETLLKEPEKNIPEIKPLEVKTEIQIPEIIEKKEIPINRNISKIIRKLEDKALHKLSNNQNLAKVDILNNQGAIVGRLMIKKNDRGIIILSFQTTINDAGFGGEMLAGECIRFLSEKNYLPNIKKEVKKTSPLEAIELSELEDIVNTWIENKSHKKSLIFELKSETETSQIIFSKFKGKISTISLFQDGELKQTFSFSLLITYLQNISAELFLATDALKTMPSTDTKSDQNKEKVFKNAPANLEKLTGDKIIEEIIQQIGNYKSFLRFSPENEYYPDYTILFQRIFNPEIDENKVIIKIASGGHHNQITYNLEINLTQDDATEKIKEAQDLFLNVVFRKETNPVVAKKRFLERASTPQKTPIIQKIIPNQTPTKNPVTIRTKKTEITPNSHLKNSDSIAIDQKKAAVNKKRLETNKEKALVQKKADYLKLAEKNPQTKILKSILSEFLTQGHTSSSVFVRFKSGKSAINPHNTDMELDASGNIDLSSITMVNSVNITIEVPYYQSTTPKQKEAANAATKESQEIIGTFLIELEKFKNGEISLLTELFEQYPIVQIGGRDKLLKNRNIPEAFLLGSHTKKTS